MKVTKIKLRFPVKQLGPQELEILTSPNGQGMFRDEFVRLLNDDAELDRLEDMVIAETLVIK